MNRTQLQAYIEETYGAKGECLGQHFCFHYDPGSFYDGWMKDPKSAMISCNDGFRPVSFYLETLEEAQ